MVIMRIIYSAFNSAEPITFTTDSAQEKGAGKAMP
jgi:hypothetical protein